MFDRSAAWLAMISNKAPRSSSPPSSIERSTSAKPRTEVRGVRSSWLIEARNSSFDLRTSCIRISASTRSVMSMMLTTTRE